MSNPVVVVEYDPAWPAVFAALRDRVLTSLGSVAVTVEHLGSTSVPGMAAKPIIDLDVVVRSAADIPSAIARLAALGYVHKGDLGIPGREAFARPPGSTDHHLYVCPSDSAELRRHLVFRDYLRAHPEEARVLGALKQEAARLSLGDLDGYMQAKDQPVKALLNRAEAWAAAS